MNIDRDVPNPETESSEATIHDGNRPSTAAIPRHAATRRAMLGGFVGLLVVVGGVYYVASRDEGTRTASQPIPEQTSPQPTPRQTPDNSTAATPRPDEQPARQAASSEQQSAPPQPPSAQPTLPQAAAPAPAAPEQRAETPPAPPVATAQDSTPTGAAGSEPAHSPNQPAEQRTQAAPGTAPAEGGQPGSVTQSSMNNQPTSLPKDEVLFVQQPRVNIRSAPGRSGRVIGTATKGSEVKVIGRSGSWVEVETQARSGWISSSLLGPHAPKSR